jgi:hypothetical protein
MRKLLAVMAAATMLMAACGGDDNKGGASGGGTPKERLTAALEANQDAGPRTVTMSLDSDAESLVALSEGDITEDTANKILDSSISISGNGESDPAKTEFAFAINIAGNTDIEFRYIDQILYFRFDVDSLLDLAGPDAKAEATQQINAAVQQAKAQGLDFVESAVKGDWIALTGLDALLAQLGMNATPSAEQQQAIEGVLATISEDATVTSEGTDDLGEHLVATANLRKMADSVDDLVKSVFGESVPTDQFTVDPNQVPDSDFDFDIWIDDGIVKQIEFDILQIAKIAAPDEEIPQGVDKLAFKVAVDDFSGDFEVPDGAVEVNVTELIQKFMGALGGTGSTGTTGSDSGTDAFCDALKDQPKSVQKAYADQCPNL